MAHAYDGWEQYPEIDTWPKCRFTTDRPHKCVDCLANAEYFILGGPVFLCKKCLDTRRQELRQAISAARLDAMAR